MSADNKQDITILRRKKARGAVLGMLDENYPTGIEYTVLERILVSAGKCQSFELQGILKYLADKQYLYIHKPEEPTIKLYEGSFVELSAHGKDLVEKSLDDDPGIEL